MSFSSNAQPPSSALHPTQLLIWFEPGTDQNHIDTVAASLGATEIWVSPLSQTRLWEFDFSLGITYEDEETGATILIDDIISGSTGVQNHKKNDSSLGGDGFNQLSKVEFIDNGPLPYNTLPYLPCEDKYRYYQKQGNHSVKVSIVDSGLPKNYTSIAYDPIIQDNYDYVINNNNVSPGGNDETVNDHGNHLLSIMNYIAEKKDTEPGSEISYDIRRVLDDDNEGNLANMILATEQALVDGAQIVNLSMSFYNTTGAEFFLRKMMDEVEALNALLVISAGNSGEDLDDLESVLPASMQSSNIITVASLSCARQPSAFSNFGETSVDVAIAGEDVPGYDQYGDVISLEGTSQSAAIISGIASVLGTLQSSFDGREIKCALIEGSRYNNYLTDFTVSDGFADAPKARIRVRIGCSTIYGGGPITHGIIDGDQQISELRSSDAKTAEAFPNPFVDNIQLSLDKGQYTVQVSNSQGLQLITKNILVESSMELHELDLSSLPFNSIHFITILTKDGKQSVHKVFRR